MSHCRIWPDPQETPERVRALAADGPDCPVRIRPQMALGGEREVDVAQEFRYRDGSNGPQAAKRLAQCARSACALARNLLKMISSASSVES